VGETFLLFEKITSPTHYANFASLICFVRRGIIKLQNEDNNSLFFAFFSFFFLKLIESYWNFSEKEE
jgi:hypothetical protein